MDNFGWANLGVSAAVSGLMGVLASYVFWLWVTRVLAPRIKYSEKISVNDKWPGGPTKYRVKIQNVGRRAAVDFQAICVLRIPGVATGENYKLVKLRTLDVPLPRLEHGHSRIITIKTDGLNKRHVRDLPDPLPTWLNQSPAVGLEKILNAFPGSEAILYLSAYDEVSGVRRSYRSRPYNAGSITRGYFKQDSVETVEGGSPV